MSEKKKTDKSLPAALGGEEVLVDPDAKANFWKPKKEGEVVTGKLMTKSTTQYGEVLNVETANGLVQIPVSVVLKKVDWDKYIGRKIFFQYKGTQKRYRNFFVKALEQ